MAPPVPDYSQCDTEKAQDKHARLSRPTEYMSVNQKFASARSDRVAFNGDLAHVLAEVLQALVSAEHQAFVETWSAAVQQQLQGNDTD